jgi:hypothetical protein
MLLWLSFGASMLPLLERGKKEKVKYYSSLQPN